MSISNTPVVPMDKRHNGDIFNEDSPNHYIVPFLKGLRSKPVKQSANFSNINLEVDSEAYAFIWNAQPIAYRMFMLISINLHDAVLIHERVLEFSINNGIPFCLDTEQDYFWKVDQGGTSND